jgi:group I intron endonuclease
MNSGIYQIKNLVTGDKYVGSSENLKRREAQHFNHLARNAHANMLIQEAYNVHGKDSFEFSLLEATDKASLRKIEQIYLDSGGFSYNIANKASGGFAVYLHPRQEEILKKRSKGLSGLKRSPETCKLISDIRTGKYAREDNPRFGKKHSPETLQKMSAKRTGEMNYRFSGYYVTPFGKFAGSTQADKACDYQMSYRTIHNHCMNPDVTISSTAYGKTKYLNQNFDRSIIGKTWRDIGFRFEPVTVN